MAFSADQAELGACFGDEEFNSFGREELMCFLDHDEVECLEANPFMENKQWDLPFNSSESSGVSDESILLVMDNGREMRVSRCEYFRLNSSRLGSLERNIDKNERPRLGFVCSIKSQKSKPCPLLSTSPKMKKFRAGAKLLREIRKYQKKNSTLSVPAMPFLHFIR